MQFYTLVNFTTVYDLMIMKRGSAGNKQIITLLSLERSLNFACNCALLIEKHEVFTQKHTTDYRKFAEK